jgi:hypothetical protein
MLILLDRRCLAPALRAGASVARESDSALHVFIDYGLPLAWAYPLAGMAGVEPPSDVERILRTEVEECLRGEGLPAARVWTPAQGSDGRGCLDAVLGEYACGETILATSGVRRFRRRLTELRSVATRHSSPRTVEFR